jgi:conjugative relaxase-like TrwC/TraI family protein
MLRMTVSTSAAAAKKYYTEGLTRTADYYLHGQGITGYWGGKTAEMLGLRGEVQKEDFYALLDNRHPETGKTLTARQKQDRRPGVDFTFNAPKGFSVLREWLREQRPAEAARLDEAFRTAVEDTLLYDVEPLIQTRVRRNGAWADRTTGNMPYAVFYDNRARPVDGIEDPHIHAHAYVPNVTWDPVEKRFKAIEYYDTRINGPYLEAAFHARLSALVRSMGYPIKRFEKWWDIDLPDALVEKFSRRKKLIEDKARKLGLIDEHGRVLDADAVAAIGAKTRTVKGESLPDAAWRDTLWKGLSPEELRALDTVASGGRPGGSGGQTGQLTPNAALEYGIEKAFARKSVVSDMELMEGALRRGFGGVLPEDLKALIPDGDNARLMTRTVEGRRLVTTPDVLAEEEKMLARARAGLDRYAPLNRQGYSYHNPDLNDGQNAAVRHVATCPDGIMMIEGGPGVGKTTAMKLAAEAIEQVITQGGRKVFTFAPTATASRDTLREYFPKAETVEHLLRNEVLHQRLRGQVIWIDEASMMGAKDMNRVFDLAQRLDCRLILSGDTKQHGPVARGDAMRLLKEKAGIRPAEVTEIMRQSGQYKDAVAAIRRGDVEHGFDLLDHLGWIREVPREVLYTLPAEDVVWYRRAGKNALLVEPTHLAGEQVTNLTRAALQKEGMLDAAERTFFGLRNLSWEAEKRDPAQYRPGLVVQFVQNARGIRNGERFQVIGVDQAGNVRARAQEGRGDRDLTLPLDHPERFHIYEPRRIGIAKGDMIQITQNGKTADGKSVSNGALDRVTDFTQDGDMVLASGKILGRDFMHFTHGYYVTSHKSQSKTVPVTITAMGADASPAVNAEQFLVTVSRSREKVIIYTDDKEALRRNIQRSSQRPSATELMAGEVTRHLKPVSVVEQLRDAAHRYRAYRAMLSAANDRAREVSREERLYGGPGMER